MSDNTKPAGRWAGREPNWGLGVALGLGIGTAIGVATDDLGVWIAIGCAFMVVFAFAFATPKTGERPDSAGPGGGDPGSGGPGPGAEPPR